MAAAKICIGFVCLVVIGRNWSFNGSTLGYETGIEKIAKGRSAPGNNAARLIKIAAKEIGVVEKTNRNDGARIAQYLSYCNIKSPAPRESRAIPIWPDREREMAFTEKSGISGQFIVMLTG